MGNITPITSTSTVNDGNFHHATLAGDTNTQSLYLDGNLVGTLSGTINHLSMSKNQIGVAEVKVGLQDKQDNTLPQWRHRSCPDIQQGIDAH